MVVLMQTACCRQVPFFSQCRRLNALDLPMWAYRGLAFKTHFLSGNNDSLHVLKRLTFHFTGCRLCRIGSFYTNLTPMVSAGLSVRALACDDIQSDKDCARRLNSGYLPKSFSSVGCCLAQYLASLLGSAWNASDDFSMRESLSNSLLCYYALLMQCMLAMEVSKKDWSKHFIPVQTLRSCLDLVGHYVLSCHHWPRGEGYHGISAVFPCASCMVYHVVSCRITLHHVVSCCMTLYDALGTHCATHELQFSRKTAHTGTPWRPKSREERTIEGGFGQIKAYSRGSPCIKDSIFGQYLVHCKQLRCSSAWDGWTGKCTEAVSADELAAIARQSLQDAAQLQAHRRAQILRCSICFRRF